MNKHFIPSRRDVLKGGGALIVSFSLAGRFDAALAQGALAAKPLALTEVDAFLAIDAKGVVTCYSGKVDLGTGISTALRQSSPTSSTCRGPGSISYRRHGLTPDRAPGQPHHPACGMQIRNAAALPGPRLEEAAKRLNLKPKTSGADGIFSGGGKRVDLWRALGGKSLAQARSRNRQSQGPKGLQVVGKPVPRVEIPGMYGPIHLHAGFRVTSCCTGRGASAAVGRSSKASRGLDQVLPGIVKVVPGHFLGIGPGTMGRDQAAMTSMRLGRN